MLTRRQFTLGLASAGASLLAGDALSGCSASGRPTASDPSGLLSLDPVRENGYLGRWFDKAIAGIPCKVTTAPGAFLEFSVRGTDMLEVTMDSLTKNVPFFWAHQIDGGGPVRLETGTREIRLPDAREHLVRITADGILETTDRWEGERGFALRGIDPGKGTCSPHELEGQVIAYYGDSITEGDCVFGAGSLPDRDSATHGYATLSARELGCLAHCNGYGGSGITEKGTFAPALNAATHYSKTRKAPRFSADLVVVEYGTNDKAASPERFADGYSRLLDVIENLHHGTQICCMVPLSQLRATEIRSCCRAHGARVVETAEWDIITVSDGVHPSVEGARKMACLLAAELGPLIS